jgi:hypothetical protein
MTFSVWLCAETIILILQIKSRTGMGIPQALLTLTLPIKGIGSCTGKEKSVCNCENAIVNCTW